MVATQCQRGSWVDADACRFRCPPLSCHVSALYLCGDAGATLDSGRSYKDVRCPNSDPKGQRGIIGLETALVLIAFVVVASVFGYVVLTTGVFATEKGRDATMAGLAQIRTTLQQRGGVTTVKALNADNVDTIKIRVSTMPGGVPIDVSSLSIRYQDSNQVADPSFTVIQIKGDDDFVLESGELFDVDVDVSILNPPLGANVDFIVIIQPSNGTPLHVNRTTAASLNAYDYLD